MVDDDSLIVSHLREMRKDSKSFKAATFSWLSKTWRAEAEPKVRAVSPGKILSYLNPFKTDDLYTSRRQPSYKRTRVKERPEFQLLLPFTESE